MVQMDIINMYKQYLNAEDFAVSDFNMTVNDGEFIVFVGPSGCGKSTTLRMIAGLEDITGGEMRIDGELMNDVPPKDRDIAMVFQSYALYPHFSVFDNMAFGLKLRKYKKEDIKEKVEEVAQILGLTEFLDRKPAALSGGQRQRVALGRAIVRDAKIFLMDEPLSNLDAKLRVAMRAEIAKLHHNLKTTSIYVTHDQTEAMTMADRIVILNYGVIQQIGSPQEVYNTPENVFVASFIGSPAMNFFEGEYDGSRFKISKAMEFKLLPEQKSVLDQNGFKSGDSLIFGIRPEDINTEGEGSVPGDGDTVNAEISVAELLGAETMVYSSIGREEFIARIDAKVDLKPGESVQYIFDLDKSHFFDPVTTERLK